MQKENIRKIINLFIDWNGENEPIDTYNLNDAVDYVYSNLKPVNEDELARKAADEYSPCDGCSHKDQGDKKCFAQYCKRYDDRQNFIQGFLIGRSTI